VPARGGGDGSVPATQSQWFKGAGRRPGTIIAAFVRARLFGLQILTLDARVALVPTDRASELTAGAGRADSRAGPLHQSTSGGYKADLADAVRLLDEGTKALEQVRRVDTP
jgi:hypothetical protein